MSASVANLSQQGEVPAPATRQGRVSQLISVTMLGALAVLFCEVLLEPWLQELSSSRTRNADGTVTGELANWPKDLKNGLYILLAAASAAKITMERRWRELRTPADIALVAVAAVMVLAGLLGTSGPVLIGEAVFVYLRGVVVFYAMRALRPAWSQIKPLFWVLGALLAGFIVIAVAQTAVGLPAYTGVGIVDAFAARNFRGQGLLHHPNDLGQVLGLVVTGLVAWLSGMPPKAELDAVGRRTRTWAWVAVTAAGVGISASQSRDALIAVLIGFAVVWFLRRRAFRTVLLASLVISLAFAANMLARPSEHLSGLIGRLGGVVNAVNTPSGQENCDEFEDTDHCVRAGQVEYREKRLLYFQQGARLLAERPVLGYGVGQFGGIVAEKHDPNWETDPRFPGGFDLHGLDGTTVDSFWLHLTVETGVLGLLVYLIWLTLLAVPLLAVTPRFAGRKLRGRRHAAVSPNEFAVTTAIWGIAALTLAVIISAFSTGLENPVFPPIVFGILGLAWVMTRDVEPPTSRAPRHARASD